MSEEAREGIEILQHHFGGVDDRRKREEGDKQTNGSLGARSFEQEAAFPECRTDCRPQKMEGMERKRSRGSRDQMMQRRVPK